MVKKAETWFINSVKYFSAFLRLIPKDICLRWNECWQGERGQPGFQGQNERGDGSGWWRNEEKWSSFHCGPSWVTGSCDTEGADQHTWVYTELDRVPQGPRSNTLYTTFKWLKNCHTPHKLMKCCSWKQDSLHQTSSSSLTSLYELH